MANLLFLPMANKLKVAVHAHAHVHAMLIEGLIGIAQGDNPRSIDTRLRSYLS
jgi:chemotaxis protein MotA